MKKEDLKTGMLVEQRDGKKGIVLLKTSKGDIVGGDCGRELKIWYPFSQIKDDLTDIGDEKFDIVKVYDLKHNSNALSPNIEDKNLLWERQEVPEYVEVVEEGFVDKKGEVYKVEGSDDAGYDLAYDGRDFIFKYKDRVKPSTKEAYEAQFKVNEMTIEELEKLTGLTNLKIKK